MLDLNVLASADCAHEAPVPLEGSTRDHRDPAGIRLQARTDRFLAWQRQRAHAGYWPYSRSLEDAPQTHAAILDCRGVQQRGVNFASQDYLSLATSEDVKACAIETIRRFGVHSAGSAAVLGNTRMSLQLETALGDFLGMEHVTLFPTGWAAGYGLSKGLVRRDDYVVMDVLAHNCLQEGANAATPKVSLFRHRDHEHAWKLLSLIRKRDAKNAILVVTEGLFSMDSDSPNLARLQDACDEFEATLVVDVAHDLGAMGPAGLGALGCQSMLKRVDMIMGSFSKTFASNGGFVASRHAGVKQYLKVFSPPQTFSNALSPAQAATVLKTLEIVRSPRGDQLRRELMANIVSLRGALGSQGLDVMGEPSPIVPVLIGREDVARVAARQLPEMGVLANLVEFPAVPQGQARFRLQVMAAHAEADTQVAAAGIAQAISEARRILEIQP